MTDAVERAYYFVVKCKIKSIDNISGIINILYYLRCQELFLIIRHLFLFLYREALQEKGGGQLDLTFCREYSGGGKRGQDPRFLSPYALSWRCVYG